MSKSCTAECYASPIRHFAQNQAQKGQTTGKHNFVSVSPGGRTIPMGLLIQKHSGSR
jgi:hypothetical protein